MQIDNMLYLEEESLKYKQNIIRNIDKQLQQLKDLDYKVAYMRDVQGKKLADIAEELGYSEQYIKEISARIGKITYLEHTDN